jgi:hypothetical protein
LTLSENYQEGYKPVVFAEIPDAFDQMTQCIFQGNALDKGDYIEVGIEIRNIEPEEIIGDSYD